MKKAKMKKNSRAIALISIIALIVIGAVTVGIGYAVGGWFHPAPDAPCDHIYQGGSCIKCGSVEPSDPPIIVPGPDDPDPTEPFNAWIGMTIDGSKGAGFECIDNAAIDVIDYSIIDNWNWISGTAKSSIPLIVDKFNYGLWFTCLSDGADKLYFYICELRSFDDLLSYDEPARWIYRGIYTVNHDQKTLALVSFEWKDFLQFNINNKMIIERVYEPQILTHIALRVK